MILTPVTLWRDFDDSLPFDEEVLSEKTEGDAVVRELYFYGRRTERGRVKIYAKYVFPAGEAKFPVVMVLFEAGFPFDDAFIRMLFRHGYGVFCVDYCGEGVSERHTEYPADVDYANYLRAGTHLDYAEPTARETSWYEWAGVARYAAKYLRERPEVSSLGAVGLRTGGEILFKIAPYADLSCMISVCAAGWLAYRGVEKFGEEGTKHVFNAERHRFIAGVDSQSYAPYVSCPVLLLSAINDKKYNYDRVYDTFRQINPEVDKAILFSAHGNGLIGSHSFDDLVLFLGKYLKKHSVFLSAPIDISVGEDEEGNLVVHGSFDENGEIKEYGVFYTEKITDSQSRDWTRILGTAENLRGNVGTVPLPVYSGSDKALVYGFVNYSNNFSVTSKIMEVNLKKSYKNTRPKSRVIYTSTDGTNGFSAFRRRARSVADCFMEGSGSDAHLHPGYGGICGITAEPGVISYRVGEPRYEPPEGTSLCFDAWSAQEGVLSVTFYKNPEEENGFTASVRVEGGGKWKNFVLDAGDFKSERGASLSDFNGVVSVVFFGEGSEILVNNVLWI